MADEVGAPLDLRPASAMTPSYLQSLNGAQPQSVVSSLLGDGSPAATQPAQAAAPQPLQQQMVDFTQQAQHNPLTGNSTPAMAPYTPQVVLPQALTQVPVANMLQMGQMPVTKQMQDSQARFVQALRQPKVSSADVVGPPIK